MSKGKWKNYEYKRSKRVTIYLNDEYLDKLNLIRNRDCIYFFVNYEDLNTSDIIRRAIDYYLFNLKRQER